MPTSRALVPLPPPMPPPPSPLVVPLSVFCVSFQLYLSTLCPSIAGGDSGELVAEGCQLGTPHPPGYPLYTVVVFLAVRLGGLLGGGGARVGGVGEQEDVEAEAREGGGQQGVEPGAAGTPAAVPVRGRAPAKGALRRATALRCCGRLRAGRARH